MKLKTVEILGFKSFAEKIKLTFSPGITAIVGPNGCGKSNIADAFRWVLGEQSAKSLRGAKMPDIIFSGTSGSNSRKARPSLPMCEVSITLTDVSGDLTLPYEELCVTRRLHRSGESEYFINRQSVRLKDIHSLFLGSGLGKNALSVFEQGKIDQVIHYTPQERRVIFEEVAGTSRLVQKRAEALRKLEQLDGNLERIGDIVGEIVRQIEVSERQAAEAEAYKTAKKRCEALKKGCLLAKWQQVDHKRNETAAKEQNQESLLAAQAEKLQTALQALAQQKEALPRWEAAFRAASEACFKASTAKQLCQQQLLTAQEQLEDLSNKRRKWQQELEMLAVQRLHAESELQQLAGNQELLTTQTLAAEQALARRRAMAEYSSEELIVQRQRHQELQNEFMQLVRDEQSRENDIKQLLTKIEGCIERIQGLKSRQQKLITFSTELLTEVSTKKASVALLVKQIDGKRELLARLEECLEEIGREENELRTSREALRKLFVEKSARYTVLLQLRNEYEGASIGCKILLEQSNIPESPLYKKIVTLAEGYQNLYRSQTSPPTYRKYRL